MEYIEQFKAELAKQEKSNNTINNYVRAIIDYAAFIKNTTGEDVNPKDIIELDVREYKSYLLNVAKQDPKTINNKLSGIIKFCDFLIALGILSTNPVKSVSKVKMQSNQTSPKTLSKNDLYRLRREFHKSNKQRDIAVFEILYNTGIRVSELCNLEIDDIELSDKKGTLIVREGKGSKYRSIPLNANARNAIAIYLKVRPLTTDMKLLQGQRGSLKRETVFRLIQKYAQQAGVNEVSPHTLRHQFCKELLNSGTDIVTVAALAGHSNINTTAIYTQPTEAEKALALEKL